MDGSGDQIVDPARRRRSRYRCCIGDDDNAAGRRSGRGAAEWEFSNTL